MRKADRLAQDMPESREKFLAVPFFAPYLYAGDETAVRVKHEASA